MTIFELTQADTVYFSDNFEDTYGIGSVYEADIYFANRLNSDEWLDASLPDKHKSLHEANDILELLVYDDEAIVLNDYTNIRRAAYEIAISLIKQQTVNEEIKSTRLQKVKFGLVETEYNDKLITNQNIMQGVISAKAWLFLKPYLSDCQSVTLTRSN